MRCLNRRCSGRIGTLSSFFPPPPPPLSLRRGARQSRPPPSPAPERRTAAPAARRHRRHRDGADPPPPPPRPPPALASRLVRGRHPLRRALPAPVKPPQVAALLSSLPSPSLSPEGREVKKKKGGRGDTQKFLSVWSEEASPGQDREKGPGGGGGEFA